MDLRQLTTLVAIADHGSFSAAARALYTVQSNVSGHVARLERELGVTLVDRQRAGSPTRACIVVERARRILHELDDSPPTWPRAATRSPATRGSASSAPPPAGCSPSCSARCRAPIRGCTSTIHEGNTSSLLPRLAGLQLDARDPPPARSTTPSCRSSRCSPRTCCSSPTAASAVSECETLSLEGARQDARCCCRREARRCGASSTGAAAAADVELQAQAEIDGVRLLASLAFEGYGPAIVPATVGARAG